ncbi:hypothetical protein EG328_000554 [Venturia inaequalis]|uniref:Prokaryotic-type class I peptide chain release factors domain-containing protein n=1 Tax=Venturia inaequalis TaxID=5025 RepID=A0A8H3VJL6_VENIN|nr:hypothetical protein EG328_000554 [Venturia inaequalis]RDI77632.1 hypothetical protein Vi05172_g12332 [Venturia inaequalis]
MALSFFPKARICLRCHIKEFLPLRSFTTSTIHAAKQLPPRRQIDESEITEVFLCGSGPGGQKINKTASAVQLKHLPTGLVVKCQATRSRDQNRKTARKILAEKLEVMELGDESRTMIKAREVARKKASKRKKSGRKYRKEDDEAGEGGGDVPEAVVGDRRGVAEEIIARAGESRPSGRGTEIGDRSLFGNKKDMPP